MKNNGCINREVIRSKVRETGLPIINNGASFHKLSDGRYIVMELEILNFLREMGNFTRLDPFFIRNQVLNKLSKLGCPQLRCFVNCFSVSELPNELWADVAIIDVKDGKPVRAKFIEVDGEGHRSPIPFGYGYKNFTQSFIRTLIGDEMKNILVRPCRIKTDFNDKYLSENLHRELFKLTHVHK